MSNELSLPNSAGLSQPKREWKEYKLDDVAFINPSELLSKGVLAKKVAMDVLQPYTKKVNSFSPEPYNGGMKFRNGDTIVARITPCLENGKTAFIDFLDNDEIGFGSTEYIVLRERENLSDKHFLYYFSISPEFREVAILSMTGSSGRQRIQTDVVREHTFLLPPLPEQKAIAGVLSSLDDKIDLLHRQNKTLEAMAETLFRQWFVLRQAQQPEADESWEEKLLGDLIDIGSGKGLKKEQFIENGIYPVLGANGGIGKTDNWLFEGELIFTGRVGTLGNIFIVNKNEKVWLSDNTLVIKPKNYFYFIYFTLKNAKLEEYNVGSTQPLIRQSDIKGIELSLPNSKLLNEFEKSVRELFDKIQLSNNQIRTLEKLRDTLLPKLMSGEIRLNLD